jgi:cytochrome oxidase Cu insertion factor (SCO1/SenC/PrrC family)
MERSSQDDARRLAQEVIDGSAPEKEKAPFRSYLQRLALMGQPISIHLTTLDGKKVDTAKLKSQVVLVVVGGPYAVPLAAPADSYEKFHARGFEIIEIAAGDKEDARMMKKFTKIFKIPWPLWCVGDAASKDLARQYGLIEGSFILLDKQGVLRATSASDALEQEIAKLLAEP